MKEVKCECGHINPVGTALCEACGRVVGEEAESSKLLDMRYEASPRRSQHYNKTFIDKIWSFFSSVKVGVWLIVITLVASALGTIFPQEMYIPPNIPAADYYKDEYGSLGKLYYQLGFHNLYSSWWYLILIASIGISLVICSLDRVIPLYKALKNQRTAPREGFLKRQRLFGITETNRDIDFEGIRTKLRSKRYSVKEENGSILAEKNRFSRWGPYVNHIGLIIFLFGGLLRFVPGMYVDEVVWVREGETIEVPGTSGQYYVKNEKFIRQLYDKQKDDQVFNDALKKNPTVIKNFQTNAVLYEKKGNTLPGEQPELKKVESHSIQVNKPMKYEDFAFYQTDYKLDEMHEMKFKLIDKKTQESFGKLTVDLYDPKKKYDLGKGYSVELLNYFPDFEFDENSEPITKSRIPNNPAFVFNMITPDKPKGEASFVAIQQTIEPTGNNKYKLAFDGIETQNVSGLTIRKDMTLWFLAIGGAIFMIGVIQGAYWNHRRIWLQKKNGQVWIAAHTNKNWFGFKREISSVLEGTSLTEPADQLNEKS
ncbi:cytochrome c biogenesis protein ResB [Peribacillus deserti]|uniref:Cytochrome C biogenesis protein n=1 Tax=Peribacillus deserti TaxID=673318 RepID=A0A2N5M1Q9_9BACI|nr:cytochrome c biogenesis protein ResB [Peribacillus deserti]PLT28289.1 cytochrome C biogenesis protein [Peribacillus deserti]